MRTYTVAEARELLPSIVPVLEGLRSVIGELRALQTAVRAAETGVSGDGALVADPFDESTTDARRMAEDRLRQSVRQLAEWGIEVKDPERGLIDFFARRRGEVVYLCYLLGEETISFWHTLEGGFAGRQAIVETEWEKG